MTTFLLLALIASQPPQAPPLATSAVLPPQAPALEVDRVAELWAKVKGGAEVTVYVGQSPPKGTNAVRLESFDGERSGVFRCYLHNGEPSYERVESAVTLPPEKKVGTCAEPIGWHRHKCESSTCGFVWSHPDGTNSAGHYCPGCGRYENDKYKGTATPTTATTPSATPKPKRVSLNGKWYDQYPDGRLVECAT